MRVGSTLYYLLGDHLGSTSITTDSSGSKVAEVRYMPWGSDRFASGSVPTDFRFTGQRRDSYINLYWYNSRWYDPYLNRWIQPDTVVPLASQGVQAFDRFAYCNNSPINFTDPSGQWIGGDAYDPAGAENVFEYNAFSRMAGRQRNASKGLWEVCTISPNDPGAEYNLSYTGSFSVGVIQYKSEDSYRPQNLPTLDTDRYPSPLTAFNDVLEPWANAAAIESAAHNVFVTIYYDIYADSSQIGVPTITIQNFSDCPIVLDSIRIGDTWGYPSQYLDQGFHFVSTSMPQVYVPYSTEIVTRFFSLQDASDLVSGTRWVSVTVATIAK